MALHEPYIQIMCKDSVEKTMVLLVLLRYFTWNSGSLEVMPDTVKSTFNTSLGLVVNLPRKTITQTSAKSGYTYFSVEDILNETEVFLNSI